MTTDLPMVLARKETVADGVVMLTLRRTDGGPVPGWEPGAHVDVELGSDLIRQYSLCGDPADRSSLQVAVLREPGGRGGSRAVHDDLAEGDVVTVGEPRNNFPLVPAARYLFIAGGIGITPLLPMIAAVRSRGAAWRLVYGGRTRASMAFLPELGPLSQVEVCPQDETGLLDLDPLLGEPCPGTAVYCCGPEPLLAAVEDRCATWPSGSLHVERFKAIEDTGPRTSFEVRLALSGTTFVVPPDRSILETLEQAGLQILSSCREGTCGTCETTVLDGEPDHHDSLLTEEERAACDTMMICVSRARSPRLVLEL
ncbi:PDR/VanB family oxidoreductase [Actinoallomurus iriomotensis]|uniref:Ferredoxin n=1 Tax=Actinoallomurus iriomotensis TaxID=478107 RepID=A0A9W6VMT9_9ACTN|nr:PDR/VanB family oxidoreductase [Actinoallomurus iriomotensis]GLY78038.1 ferredoxin [Actinoallomurus iriomotensis]